VRVIYFYHDANHPLYLLMVYAKARHENLSPDERRTVREITALLKGKPKRGWNDEQIRTGADREPEAGC
jgi:hypothetical protein